MGFVNFVSRPCRGAFLNFCALQKVTFQYISFTEVSLPSLCPPPNKARYSGLFELIYIYIYFFFRIENIPTCRGLALTRSNTSGMIPLQHNTEEVRKLALIAAIVPVRFATSLMFHTVGGFLVHQQKRCSWCVVPFALDYKAVTRIRGKHRLSAASNSHFPAYIRG